MSCTMVSWSTSGRPRQFSVMWQKRRCSILFHLDVCFSYPHTLPSALDGDTRVGTVTTPGQTVAWTFTATAGQRASITSSAAGHATHKLYAPSGAQLFSDTTGVVNMFSGALALPEPGTYRWVVDPTAMALPSESVTAYLLPDDLAEVATIGGDATPMDSMCRGSTAASRSPRRPATWSRSRSPEAADSPVQATICTPRQARRSWRPAPPAPPTSIAAR